MNKSRFIVLKAADPFTEDPTTFNEMYVRPSAIMHFEPYSGPFGMMAWGPNGQCQPMGRFKQVFGGSLAVLYGGGSRIYLNSPNEIMKMIEESEQEFA